MITKEGVQQLDAILRFKQVTNAEIVLMENWMKEHIDRNVTICRHCSAQIRHAHQRIQNWAAQNAAMIEYVRNYQPKEKCLTCGKDIEDSRRKHYCSDGCKKIAQNGTNK
jgi:hypothetical protein